MSLGELRCRIHEKSRRYRAYAYERMPKASWGQFYGALDALLDVENALSQHAALARKSTMLECSGFLQNLIVAQDAVQVLNGVVRTADKWTPWNDACLARIRDVRVRVSGHPAYAGEQKLRSSAIHAEIFDDGFKAIVYRDDGMLEEEVNFQDFAAVNERALCDRMKIIEASMDETEEGFLAANAIDADLTKFLNDYSYCLTKLARGDRRHLVTAYADQLGDLMKRLRMFLERIKSPSEELRNVDLITQGARWYAEVVAADEPEFKQVLLFDGIAKNLDEIADRVRSLRQ